MIDPFTSHHEVEAEGVRVHVAEAGDGPPLVLLHGNPDTHAVWGPVVERLARSFRCIAPDIPGFGKTHAPDDFDVSLPHQGVWVRALLDALGLDRVHLVVHDIGGSYGLSFATQHPGRLRALTIMDAVFAPDYRWHFWARVWRTRGLGELSMKVMNRPLFRRELRRGSPHMTPEYIAHAWQQLTPATFQNVLRWYREMDPARWEGWDQRLVAAIADVPHQVIWGDRDPYIPARFADRFGGTVHHLPDDGHWVMIEAPDRCAELIRALG